MVEIYNGGLNVEKIVNSWYNFATLNNYGAFITFIGVVRDENGIEGLSFDIYKPLLDNWFQEWQNRIIQMGGNIKMAHSKGDVLLHQTSFISAIYSSKRGVALKMIDKFVEDFKANAPIWKYDIINGNRVYAKDRSQKIEGSGLLKRVKI